MKELDIQTLFRSKVKNQCAGVSIVAIPNAAKRGQKAMNQARREGAAWGFPDVMALAPGKIAFIEFKSAKGQASDKQDEWHIRLNNMGFPCKLFRDADSALDFLREQGFPFLGAAQ